MQFASDNWAGAAPEIIDAIAREAARFGDRLRRRARIDRVGRARASAKSSSARSRSSSSRPGRPRTRSRISASQGPAASSSATARATSSRTNAAASEFLTGGARRHRSRRRGRQARPRHACSDALRAASPGGLRASRSAGRRSASRRDRGRRQSTARTRSRRSPRSRASAGCRFTWTARASPMRSCARRLAGGDDLAGRRRYPLLRRRPRTAASRPRRWSSSIRRTPATRLSCASAPASSSRSRASSRRSSTRISATTSG